METRYFESCMKKGDLSGVQQEKEKGLARETFCFFVCFVSPGQYYVLFCFVLFLVLMFLPVMFWD